MAARNAPLRDRDRLEPARTAATAGLRGVVEAAIARLDQDFGLFDASPIILNAAHGGAGRDFANAVALVESELEPPEMLDRLKAIEREFGRRRGRRWGPRVLDLDIVLWSGGTFALARAERPAPAARQPRLRASAARRDRARLARSMAASPRAISLSALPAAALAGNGAAAGRALSSVGRATDF